MPEQQLVDKIITLFELCSKLEEKSARSYEEFKDIRHDLTVIQEDLKTVAKELPQLVSKSSLHTLDKEISKLKSIISNMSTDNTRTCSNVERIEKEINKIRYNLFEITNAIIALQKEDTELCARLSNIGKDTKHLNITKMTIITSVKILFGLITIGGAILGMVYTILNWGN